MVVKFSVTGKNAAPPPALNIRKVRDDGLLLQLYIFFSKVR